LLLRVQIGLAATLLRVQIGLAATLLRVKIGLAATLLQVQYSQQQLNIKRIILIYIKYEK